MRRYLVDKKDDIRGLDVRERLVEFPLHKNFITSVVGPRRAGKTYSLYGLILNKKSLRDEDYLFLNFEDYPVSSLEIGEVAEAVSLHQELYGREPEFIFLDEVQGLKKWETLVYTLYEKKRYFLFITGSSSKLLSREIATQLRGRAVSTLVLPLSFREFLMSRGELPKEPLSTRAESSVRGLLRAYLADGGFPDIVFTSVNRKAFFRDYLDLVVFKDVVERFGIKEPHVVRLLIAHLLSSFSGEFSVNRVFNSLKSEGIKVSKKTLYGYADALEEAMFCFFLPKFSPSLRKSFLSVPKIYLNDPGLINHLMTTKLDEEIGKLMENTVFLELKRRGETELFYWRDHQGREVDFAIREGASTKKLIQVTYASGRDEVERRELDGILKASRAMGCKELEVITWDYEESVELEGKRVRFVPLWRWLCSPS
jgi:predicted AAA+ superfamily ATPase